MSSVSRPTIGSANLRAQAEAAVRELQQRLWTTRRSLIAHRIVAGSCLIFAVGALCLVASATADLKFELSSTTRAAWMFGVVIAAIVAAATGWQKWIATYTLSDTAADTERQLVQFGQRLRTTLDYEQQVPAPAAASPSLLHSLQNETQALVQQTEWSEAIDARPLWRSLAVAVTVAIGWLGALILIPEFRIASARAMLLPYEYTTVTYSPDQVTIKPDESVTFNVVVSGRPVSSAVLRHQVTGTETWENIDLLPEENDKATKTGPSSGPVLLHGKLVATLDKIMQDIEIEVIAGPRSLPKGHVRVLQPLTLQKSEARIDAPAYTGRSVETVQTLDLRVLEGSNVQIKLELNRPAAEARLVRTDALADAQAIEVPLQLQDNFVVASLSDLRKNAAYNVTARTADGMSLDPVPISIRVQLDRKPEVVFIEPPEELVVTPSTEVPIIVEAKDDLGLYKVGVMFQIGDGPLQSLIEENLEGLQDPGRVSSTVMLEDFGLTHQDAVTYYAFAEDNYFGQPRRTTTPLRFIDIRPYKMSFQVVEANCPPCNGASVTLEELITRQRQGLAEAFQAGQQSPAKDVTSKLSEAQEELLDATAEFAKGMAERGADLPSLTLAIAHMETAIEALDAVDAPAAVPAEQSALTELIHARENLRKILKQSNSQSSSACRNFDRQQRQKLRMPEKKKSDQQQQLAEARKKLDELARKERQWSKQASQCCNSSSSSSGKPSQSQSKPSESNPSQPNESTQDSKPSESSQGEKNETPTPEEVAAAQEKLQAELAELQQQLQKLNAAGQAAKAQAEQAAESMKQGLAELKNKQGEAAAHEGERTAKQLEQLSDHLAAMNARDFGQRLDQAQKLAQQLANRQESIANQVNPKSGKSTEKSGSQSDSGSTPDAKSGQKSSQASSPSQAAEESSKSGDGSGQDHQKLARDQQSLATQTGLLADLLDALQREARREASSVQQKLEQAQAENPPRDIAAGMRQTADHLQANRQGAASSGVTQAQRSLQELSKALGTARADYAQPQLKELMALEEQLAQLQQQMKRGEKKSDDAASSLEQKWQQMQPRLDRLATADPRLAKAMRELREGPQSNKAGTESGTAQAEPGSKVQPAPFRPNGGQPPEGFYSRLELGDYSGVREVSKALQMKIQEAILAGALMDADQPVPPAYKELVEKYYKALSDDLR